MLSDVRPVADPGLGVPPAALPGVGNPFGSRARFWAILIMVATAVASTCVGLLIVAASRNIPAYVGIVVPAGCVQQAAAQRDRDLLHRTLPGVLTLPLSRLYDRMGDDMQDWCDTRVRAAEAKPQWIADAVTYYYSQVQGGLKDGQARADLGRWQESITHKISIVRLISLDTTPARLGVPPDALLHPAHPQVRRRRPAAAGPPVETEALNMLDLFLAYVYRLGHHRLLIYPFRPSVHRAPARAEPTAPDL